MTDVTTPNSPFNLKAVHLISGDGEALDIAAITLGFTLYESINSKFLTGDITLVDGLNLIKNYRFTGQEHIRLHFTCDPDDSGNVYASNIDSIHDSVGTGINALFRVYKLENVERPKAVMQTYEMKLCDPYMFNANTTRLSKVYRGSYSEMLKKVFSEFGHEGIQDSLTSIEETKSEKGQFIVPNWRATTFIDWIVKNADNKTGSWRNSMFFYQTFKEGFCFKSLANMCGTSDAPPALKELHYPAGAGEEDAYEGGLPKQSQLLQVSKPQVFDSLRATAKGAYASKSLTYDPVTKIESRNKYDILETFERGGSHVSNPAHPIIRTGGEKDVFVPHSSKDSNHFDGVVTKQPLAHLSTLYPNQQDNSFVLYDYNTNHDFDNSEIVNDESWEGTKVRDNSKLERIGLLEILKQHRVVVTLPIRTDISVGEIVDLKIAEPEIAERDTKDLINDNRYLVVDSCYSVNLAVPGLYGSLQLELVKESFAQEVNEENVSALLPVSDAYKSLGPGED